MKQMCISYEETTDYFRVHMNFKNVYAWINLVVSKTEYKFETIYNRKNVFAKTPLAMGLYRSRSVQ